MSAPLAQFSTVRTTITVPLDLINRSQHFIESGEVPNRNALIVTALEQFLNELERREIDRQFAMMADDESYLELNEQLSESFAESDWETLRENEGE